MSALAERGATASVSRYSACDVCGTADVLELGICASCARGASDALVFVEPSERRADREALGGWLVDAFGGTIGALAAREAAEGLRPIVGLPTMTAGQAAATLSLRGVPAVAVSREEAWKRVPRGLSALAGAAAGMGLFLGLTANAAMFILGPVFGGLLILAASRQTREPIWIPEASAVFKLPPSVETDVRGTLAGLRHGRARERLKGIVAVATALDTKGAAPSTGDLADAIGEVLSLSCRAAVDLDQLDRSLEVLQRSAEDQTDPALSRVIVEADAARDALLEQLGNVLATLVGAQTAASNDPADLHSAAKRLSDEIGLRAQAWKEVRRYTS